jgi:catechol 2,3-dioxygenase-like lactoylglutathione lyase family enzyme
MGNLPNQRDFLKRVIKLFLYYFEDMNIEIKQIDHVVLTVQDPDRTIEFYTRVLGMQEERFAGNRIALKFGEQKINLHIKGKEFKPGAEYPTPGSSDFCLISKTPLDKVIEHLKSQNIKIVLGPTDKVGAHGPIRSVYIRDPDMNLVEISEYI